MSSIIFLDEWLKNMDCLWMANLLFPLRIKVWVLLVIRSNPILVDGYTLITFPFNVQLSKKCCVNNNYRRRLRKWTVNPLGSARVGSNPRLRLHIN